MKNLFNLFKKLKKTNFVRGDVVRAKKGRLIESLGNGKHTVYRVENNSNEYPTLKDLKYSGGQIIYFKGDESGYYSIALEKL